MYCYATTKIKIFHYKNKKYSNKATSTHSSYWVELYDCITAKIQVINQSIPKNNN
jgi:hypothetical protein